MFVTSVLHGALPKHVQERLNSEARLLVQMLNQMDDSKVRAGQAYIELKRLFGRWDYELDHAKDSPRWLGDKRIASIIAGSLHHLDQKMYSLIAFTVMPNHVHTVFKPLYSSETNQDVSIAKIMQSWKRYSARNSNDLLGRSGQFWQHENYDHVARDTDELTGIINYVLNNPVKVGLAKKWQDWPWTYLTKDITL